MPPHKPKGTRKGRRSLASGGGSTIASGELRCHDYDITFSRAFTLDRHLRETKRHQKDNHAELGFTCSDCPVSCTRLYDLQRHQIEQHGVTHVEEQCDLSLDNTELANDVAFKAQLTLDSIELATNFELDIFEQDQYTGRRSGKMTRTLRSRKLTNIVCGHCRQPFECNDTAVSHHLDLHLQELKDRHTCADCNFSFVRLQDLILHRQNAKDSPCGFLNHDTPCGGHHPPDCSERRDFCYRVRHWEQSQLQLLGRCVDSLMQLRKELIAQRLGSGAQYFARQQLPWSYYQKRQYHTTASTRRAFSDLGAAKASSEPKSVAGSLGSVPTRVTYAAMMGPSDLRVPDESKDVQHSPDNMYDSGACPESEYDHWGMLGKALAAQVYEMARKLAARASIAARPGASWDFKDALGRTLLHLIVRDDNRQGLGLLLELGADMNATNNAGETPLMNAAHLGRLWIVHSLLEHGADFMARNAVCCTPLHHAASSRSSDNVQLVIALLDKGADPPAQNAFKYTPLDLAFLNHDTKLIRVLAPSEDDFASLQQLILNGAPPNPLETWLETSATGQSSWQDLRAEVGSNHRAYTLITPYES